MKKKLLLLFSLVCVTSLTAQGYICAVGGGREDRNKWSDEPYGWMVQQAQNGPALLLHYDDVSPSLESYFKSVGATSVQSLAIPDRKMANDSTTYRKIRAARLIFLRGGNQYRYYENWQGTLSEQALLEVYQSGGVIGGTSAGLAILGEIDYIAANGSAISAECLRNPFHRDITLANDFLNLVPGVIFDSHCTERGRQGRLLAFVAHWNTTRSQDILGVGVDPHTAVCIEPGGKCFVSGAGSVYIIHQNPNSQLWCESGQPLFLTNWTMHALTAGFRYNLKSRELIAPAEGAQQLPAESVPIQTPAARILLQSNDQPSAARDYLQRLCDTAQGAPIVLLTRENDSAYETYLKSVLNYSNVIQIPVTSANVQSTEKADLIQQSNHFVLTPLPLAEVANYLTAPTPVFTALTQKCNLPAVTLLLLDTSIPLAGPTIIPNLETGEYNLQDGKLTTAPGLGLLKPVCLMPAAFEYDDFKENRVGGLFWQLFKHPHGLGLLMDNDTALEIYNNQVQVQSRTPVLFLDQQSVTVIDSSDYRPVAYYQPRQATAFVGGRLHCRPRTPAGSFDLTTRTFSETAPVEELKGSQHLTPPQEFQLKIYPNPGKDYFNFQFINDSNQKNALIGVTVYNLLGQKITDIKRNRGPSVDLIHWLAQDYRGHPLPAGIYLAAVQTRAGCFSQKFCILP